MRRLEDFLTSTAQIALSPDKVGVSRESFAKGNSNMRSASRTKDELLRENANWSLDRG